jgi:hypothetical protein
VEECGDGEGTPVAINVEIVPFMMVMYRLGTAQRWTGKCHVLQKESVSD